MGILNVRDFGAVGDGTTDDHGAFQRTLAEVVRLGTESGFPHQTGTKILIPAGIYLLGHPLRLEMCAILEGGDFMALAAAIAAPVRNSRRRFGSRGC